jgi:GNAT superfamily N-acetyltransferase
MTHKIVPFTQEYLDPAVALFQQVYRNERLHSPCLPSRALDDPAWIRSALEAKLANPGMAVFEEDRLLAYMLTGDLFDWKGQRAVFLPEYAHASTAEEKPGLYQVMYQSLAQGWVDQGRHMHLVGYFAHDDLLKETLYQLGFGALVTERLRDTALLEDCREMPVTTLQDPGELVDLHMEHVRYYPQSPIFISRLTDRPSALADLQSHLQNGDVIFVAYDRDEPGAYMIVGESALGSEGFLLQQTKTAQVKSAYARPEMRGKGVGAALLQHVLRWARQQGYERIFVEHETANLSGGKFWSKHFTAYLTFAMRYVDNSL